MTNTRTVIRWRAAALLVVCVLLRQPQLQAEDGGDRVTIQPNVASFFQNRCSGCHAKGSSKSGFSIAPLLERGTALDGERFRAYEKAFHQVAKGKMPPPPNEDISPKERTLMAEAMEKQLWHFVDSEGHRDAKPFSRRLNRVEFENTFNDVLGMPRGTHGFRPFHHLLPEETAIDGFETVGVGLSLSKLHLELYLQLAERQLTH